ncbi:hypothetical protein I4U23_022559 [Adineta vaga]|nr:hypothetical protein I4U23_022559 [Adineta vaga]
MLHSQRKQNDTQNFANKYAETHNVHSDRNKNIEGIENTMKYPDYDDVAQLPYMDMFISEVLRMHPIENLAVQRRATDVITIQVIYIQKDDLYSFILERHQTKRHPMSYLAFGAGPRSCICMRFALMEIQILLTRLVRDYTMVPDDHLESKFKILDPTIITPKEIWIKLLKRNT